MNVAAAATLVSLAWLAASITPQRSTSRVQPPAGIECGRNQLTAYTGTVTRLTRDGGQTRLEIRTDWDTTEAVVIMHPGAEDASRWFLVRTKPFSPRDWAMIESAPGKLRSGVRATAWVCEGGKNPIVDWSPAAEPPPGR